jgi:hypothetical protein
MKEDPDLIIIDYISIIKPYNKELSDKITKMGNDFIKKIKRMEKIENILKDETK